MNAITNSLIKLVAMLGGVGCIVAAYFAHQAKSNDWGWFLFVGLIIVGGVMTHISEEKK